MGSLKVNSQQECTNKCNEKTDCLTDRAVRSLVAIRRADEMSTMEEIGEVSRYVENQRRKICGLSAAGECDDTATNPHSSAISVKCNKADAVQRVGWQRPSVRSAAASVNQVKFAKQ